MEDPESENEAPSTSLDPKPDGNSGETSATNDQISDDMQ